MISKGSELNSGLDLGLGGPEVHEMPMGQTVRLDGPGLGPDLDTASRSGPVFEAGCAAIASEWRIAWVSSEGSCPVGSDPDVTDG
jgi:hypothetical protein